MSFVRSVFAVGGLTLISRILGFLRDQLVAFVLGTGPVAEAFFVAQRFPNLFRALFAEGAFNAAFVPHFSQCLQERGQEAAHRFARDVFSVLLVWLIIFSIFVMMGMPAILFLIAPGFRGSRETFELTVTLTQICFPYLTFMSLVALQSGVLNSLNRFTAAAAAPILLNLCLILANVVAWFFEMGNTSATGYVLSFGIVGAGVCQYLLLAEACRRIGLPLFLTWPKLTADVKIVLRRSVPGLFSGGVMQINVMISTMLATQIDHGVSYLYYADRLYQLPLGVIGVAIGVVLLPELSRKIHSGSPEDAIFSQNRALELALFFMLPAAVTFVVLSENMIRVLFEHGAFGSDDTKGVAKALVAFAFGLPAYASVKVFQPGFYARGDTQTPMRMAMLSVGVTIAASFALVPFWGHVGLAFASSLSAWLNGIGLFLFLRFRRHYFFDALFLKKIFRLLLASFVLAGSLWLSQRIVDQNIFVDSFWGHLALLGGLLCFGGCCYGGVCLGLGVIRWADVRFYLKKEKRS